MAKRGRVPSVDKMMARLSALDAERKALMAGIRAAVDAVMGSQKPSTRVPSGGSVEGFTNKPRMSAAGRKAISEAQKKRWAAVRRAK